jgi:hypothetical protein
LGRERIFVSFTAFASSQNSEILAWTSCVFSMEAYNWKSNARIGGVVDAFVYLSAVKVDVLVTQFLKYDWEVT